ncbi:FHA domain-containing protein [Phototrophicus methaneseepsis]|uniref:FHA domain-containing protein n=1 Tax=Phototrophicus methaneseepsis TaxID=2710758 RepID=A0A7S8ECM5_9CHLR|nr:FHA domain-containing protein [Phototrophicus methaneseepsis]QPC84293.1 FHA domain-containing protein [Phototrophicus methaneseepsis]
MQGNDSYRLVVRRGPQPNQVYELSKEVMNLGRDITNDIVINDREVSRHHLRFTHGTSGYTIEDSGSTNGTFVNGKRITGATPLKNGDMIGLGETVTLGYELTRPEGAGGVSDAASGATMPSASGQPPQQSYQPPQRPAGDEAYRPPQQQQQPSNPYQAPQQSYQQPQQPSYQQPQEPSYAQAPYQDAYQQDPYQQGYQQPGEQAYYQQPGTYGPPPSGYDYDPYAVRDEEGGGAARWILYGCIGLMVLCCCITILVALAVDTLCLYNSIPFLTDILSAFGLPPTC